MKKPKKLLREGSKKKPSPTVVFKDEYVKMSWGLYEALRKILTRTP